MEKHENDFYLKIEFGNKFPEAKSLDEIIQILKNEVHNTSNVLHKNLFNEIISFSEKINSREKNVESERELPETLETSIGIAKPRFGYIWYGCGSCTPGAGGRGDLYNVTGNFGQVIGSGCVNC